jgi:hypothetical protein
MSKYFQDNKLSASSFTQVGESAMLLSVILGTKEVDVRVASSGATFVPGFVTVCKLVQMFKWQETQSGDFLSILAFVNRGK